MPFKALDRNGVKQISYLLQPEQYRQVWTCPNCEQLMSFVDIHVREKHFRHRVKSHCKPEPETKEHLSLKEWVYSWLSSAGYDCEYEEKIGNRIADITFRTKNSKKLRVVECQVSPISAMEVQQRNYDYRLNGVHDVYWILHPKNYLKTYQEYRRIYRLKEVESTFRFSYYFLHFDLVNNQIKKYFFTPKRMKGGRGRDCSNIYLKRDELPIPGKYLPNWGLIENWIDGRCTEFKEPKVE